MKAKMKARRFVFVASCLCAATAHAADLYYDLDPATSEIDGGVGNWADANWKTTPGGTSGTNWSANDSAFLNPIIGSPDATTITLSGPQAATAVIFDGAGYTLTGGTLSLNGNFTGDVSVTGGLLQARSATSLGTGTVSATGLTSDSGAIDLNGFSFANNIIIGNRSAGPGAAGALQNTNTSAMSVLDGNVAMGGENYVGGNGKSGYFQQGSFQAVIIPEPAAALLAPLGLLALLRRRRETLHPHADS